MGWAQDLAWPCIQSCAMKSSSSQPATPSTMRIANINMSMNMLVLNPVDFSFALMKHNKALRAVPLD
jgi:hypothetical protein